MKGLLPRTSTAVAWSPLQNGRDGECEVIILPHSLNGASLIASIDVPDSLESHHKQTANKRRFAQISSLALSLSICVHLRLTLYLKSRPLRSSRTSRSS